MKIAIASGKGGTGKTTVAVSLALALARKNDVTLVDCDVEEPNAALFVHPEITATRRAQVPAYAFSKELCDGCGACAKACRFNAIAVARGSVLFFPELCHGCGGCVPACPRNAVSETTRENGGLTFGGRGPLKFAEARLDIGEAMAAPLIRYLKQNVSATPFVLYDCPPGTACSMIEAVRHCDLALLVSEPTPFGLNDFKLAVAALEELGIPFRAVINRDGCGNDELRDYCRKYDIEIALSIPDDRKIAEAYSRGTPLVEVSGEYAQLFAEFAGRIANGGLR